MNDELETREPRDRSATLLKVSSSTAQFDLRIAGPEAQEAIQLRERMHYLLIAATLLKFWPAGSPLMEDSL